MPTGLGETLRRAYLANAPDAQRLDDRVLGAAPAPPTIRFRRLAPWTGLAAAAGLVLTVSLAHLGGLRGSVRSGSGQTGAVVLRADLDGSGRVDILDAFLVARSIAAGAGASGALNPAWDVTGDGAVDRRDVDAVAAAAVSLGGAL